MFTRWIRSEAVLVVEVLDLSYRVRKVAILVWAYEYTVIRRNGMQGEATADDMEWHDHDMVG